MCSSDLCHGDPSDAPAELIAMYGDQAGFHEKPDAIRALISIRVSLENIIAAGNQMASKFTMVTFVVLSVIYLVFALLIRRIDGQEREIRVKNDNLERLSMTDLLTGAYNRVGLRKRSAEVIKRAQRFQHPVALLLLDLDHFKQVNDRYGHPAGDAVLKRFSETIQANLRGSDIFGRWGGEEFLVISPHQGLSEAAKMAEKLRRAIETAEFPESIHLTTSIGVSQYRPGESDADVIARADQALYTAKSRGRNQVVAEAAPA